MQFKLCELVKNGFKFGCQICGNCCKGKKKGYIFTYKPDLEKLFEYFKCTTEAEKHEFAKKHLEIISQKFVYKDNNTDVKKNYYYDTLVFKLVGENEECCFLGEKNMCKIYSVKPFQCISYPVWRIILTIKKNWDENLKKCKGINITNGEFYSQKKILDILKKEFQLEKNFFLEMKAHNFKIKEVYSFLRNINKD